MLPQITKDLSTQLAEKSPGKMSHARWLTTANRVLCSYVATLIPYENLEIITQYIMKVYAPTWFNIKTDPHITSGAKHLWGAINASRQFSENVKKTIDKVFATNAYFAHLENIILTILVNSRKHIRQLAIKRIQIARKRPVSGISF